MEALDFDWDDANVAHVVRHQVVPREAEEAVLLDPVDLGSEVVDGEERYASLGATAKGRVLLVVTTWRNDRIRVVTAFELNKRLVQLYYLSQRQ